MKTWLGLLFTLILIAMIWVTTWASLHENVFAGGRKVLSEPWGVATVFDAYFGFITFYVWLAYKETSNLARFVWLILVLLFGNIAMSIYVLIQLKKVRGEGIEAILLRMPNEAKEAK